MKVNHTLIFFAILLLVAVPIVWVANFSTYIIIVSAYICGLLIVGILNSFEDYAIRIFSILFFTGSLNAIGCYFYMVHNGYNYLFAPDIINTFYPMNMSYLEEGEYFNIVKSVWSEYQFFDRRFVGYYTYTTFWGMIANRSNANLFLILQISSVFIFGLIGVLLNRIFLNSNFSKVSSFYYSLIVSLGSILFFLSSVFLRDIHIALLYLIAINITLSKNASFFNFACLLIVILITCTFRIESGIFLFSSIPVYFLSNLKQSRKKFKAIFLGLTSVLFLVVCLLYFKNSIEIVVQENFENYSLKDRTGIIGLLQTIPIIGDLLSIIYTAIQPLPFWAPLSPTVLNSNLGPEVFNIMRFSQSVVSVLNWWVVFYLISWILIGRNKFSHLNLFPKAILFHLVLGVVFFGLQSSVVEQRRIVPYYCVFYLLFFSIYEQIDGNKKFQYNLMAAFLFIANQLYALVFLIHE